MASPGKDGTIAVVGATGYLGRCLVRATLDAGYHVTACVRPGSDVTGLADASTPPGRLTLTRAASPTGLPAPADLAGAAALICAVAGRANRTCSTADMRAVEVDFPVALYATALAADPPPGRAVFFVPGLAAMAAARGPAARPSSEYVTAKEDMVVALRSAEKRELCPITIVQVAAWGRDCDPIAAAVARAPAWLPAVPAVVVVPSASSSSSRRRRRGGGLGGGGRDGGRPGGGAAAPVPAPMPRLAPVDEADLAARVVAGLSSPSDCGATLSLGGPAPLTHADLWRAAGAAAGRRVAVVRLPAWAVGRLLLPAVGGAAALAGGGAPGLRAAAYLLRIATDAAVADLVGEEAVGTVTPVDRVGRAVADVRAGRALAGR